MRILQLCSCVILFAFSTAGVAFSATVCTTLGCNYHQMVKADKTEWFSYQCGGNTSGKVHNFQCTTEAQYMECKVTNPGPETGTCTCDNKDFFEKHQANIYFNC